MQERGRQKFSLVDSPFFGQQRVCVCVRSARPVLMPHVVSLQVPDGYQLSAEWSTRSPHEVATLLDVAVQLSSLVSEHHLEDHVRGWLDGGFERHSRASESKIQDLHRSLAQSEATLLQTEARVDSAMASTRLECESRLQRLQMQYDHLELEVEARKQEAEAQCRAKARAEVEEKIVHLESQLEESRNARLIAEVKTLETMQAKCVDVERYSHDCQQLRERISELETPMARGRSGELLHGRPRTCWQRAPLARAQTGPTPTT